MKEGKGSFLAALWWMLGCLCLGTLLLALAPKESRPSAEENRMLAGFPELTLESLRSGAFFSGIEDYLSDGFFFRQEAVDAAERMEELWNRQTEDERLIAQTERMDRMLVENNDGALEEEEAEEEEKAALPTLSPAPTPAPTATAAPAASPAPTVSPTPVPAPAAALDAPSPAVTVPPTPSSAPTPTPKIIVPLEEDAVYTLTLLSDDGKNSQVYDYPAQNLETFADHLNYLKTLLPEDGEIHFMQVPVSAVGQRVGRKGSRFTGWVSDMEEALQSQVREGIEIYNAPAILNDALSRGETLYYHTDHHWTPLGAWYAIDAVMQRRGYPTVPYEEYEYLERVMGRDDAGRTDTLAMLYPLAPVRSTILTQIDQEKELDFMNYKGADYAAYINNTRTPWRRFETGFQSSRRALLISDSFGNVFLPYLLPYYGEVHMTDLRRKYYDAEAAGASFAELVRIHEITDVYIVLATSSGVNSENSLVTFRKAIEEGGNAHE